MINLSLKKLKLLVKNRGIKDYNNKSEDDLIKILSAPKPKSSLSKKKTKDIKKDFHKLRDRFLKPKIKGIRRNLHGMENKKNLSKPKKKKKIEENVLELEKSPSKL